MDGAEEGGAEVRRVEVVEGPFAGAAAEWDGVAEGRVRLRVAQFGRTVPVVLSRCQVALPPDLHPRGLHTTRALPVDLAAHLPEVLPLARTTTRLHPCPGFPTPADSSVGGPPLWPAGEPWPTCEAVHKDPSPDGPVPLVPLVQLRAADAPALPFPAGADLLQVLWCPYDHPDDVRGPWPRPALYWRTAAEVGAALPPAAMGPFDGPSDTVPRPCLLDPEEVVEYPNPDELDAVEYRRERWEVIERLEAETGWSYGAHLADAPGVKAGGWPGWTQPPDWPECGCGRRMAHLLTVASREYDVCGGLRWAPVEHVGGPADPGAPAASPDPRVVAAVEGEGGRDATGLCIGDVGGMYLFVCRDCPDTPWAYRFDCS